MSADQTSSNPYRKVSVATWSDRKVSSLSPLQPSGQALFLMLMVGPQSTNLPGVQPIGRLAFAEQLQWEPEAFDEAFGEVSREGLAKADWKARLVFVPKAIKHNLPQSPNVVKSWGSMWARVPECDLKTEAWHVIYAALSALGKAFAEAFKSACPLNFSEGDEPGGPASSANDEAFIDASGKPSGKPSPKTMPNQEAVNRKQEVGEKDAIASSSASPPGRVPDLDSARNPPSDPATVSGGEAGDLRCPAEKIIELYHELLPELPSVRLQTDGRTKALGKTWRWVMTSRRPDGTRRATTADEGLAWFREYFERASQNAFLMGRTTRTGTHAGWVADLDFLLTDKGKKHVIERTEAVQ